MHLEAWVSSYTDFPKLKTCSVRSSALGIPTLTDIFLLQLRSPEVQILESQPSLDVEMEGDPNEVHAFPLSLTMKQ